MATFTLTDYATTRLALGRASLWVAGSSIATAGYWDGAAEITLTHIGITMGEIGPPEESPTNNLTLEELTGEAVLEASAVNPNAVIEFDAIVSSQAQAELFSPTGSGSAGYRRPPPVKEHTLVLFPESLLIEGDPPAEVSLAYSGGAWTVGGDAATTEQLALIDLSIWFWRGYFMRTPPVFRYENGGRAERTVRFQVMQDLTKPNGEQLWTLGDPADAGIDIEVVS